MLMITSCAGMNEHAKPPTSLKATYAHKHILVSYFTRVVLHFSPTYPRVEIVKDGYRS